MALCAFIISLAAIAVSTYSVTKDIQAAPSATATQRSTGENFKWKLGEVVDVQGNLYVYQGWNRLRYSYGTYGSTSEYYSLSLARWQNRWLQLTYPFYTTSPEESVTLSPYKLQVFSFNNDYLNATFLWFILD